MSVETHRIETRTRGDNHVVDLTPQVLAALEGGKIQSGTVTVFVVGSTASISTTEYEPGLASHDLAAAYEKFAPRDGAYEHERTWHDDNGHSHVRATFTGPSVTVPLVDGRLTLGTWQQIVLLDFDTRERQREIIVQVVGE
ncbi:MAG: secondary thiamine-phosphate synthase enzyme YjbQ [Planctomycetota bacterium]|nr:secondary thiamine-phosphate synthase enzyme YjbQ [Planctomycetota bacterium]